LGSLSNRLAGKAKAGARSQPVGLTPYVCLQPQYSLVERNIGASGWELTEEQVNELSETSAIEDVYPYRFIRNAQRV